MKVKRSLRILVSNIAPTITSMDGTSTEHDEKRTTDNEIHSYGSPIYLQQSLLLGCRSVLST